MLSNLTQKFGMEATQQECKLVEHFSSTISLDWNCEAMMVIPPAKKEET